MGTLRGKHLVTELGSYGVYDDISRTLSLRFDPDVALVPSSREAPGGLSAISANQAGKLTD